MNDEFNPVPSTPEATSAKDAVSAAPDAAASAPAEPVNAASASDTPAPAEDVSGVAANSGEAASAPAAPAADPAAPQADGYPNPFAPPPAAPSAPAQTGYVPYAYPVQPGPAPAAGAAPYAAPAAPYGAPPPVQSGYIPASGAPAGYVPNAQPVGGYVPNANPAQYAGTLHPGYGYPPYAPSYGATGSASGGSVPPAPPAGYVPYGAPPRPPKPRKSGRAGQIVMWIIAAVIEAVIVGFAIYGVYALCTRDSGSAPTRPPYSDSQRPDTSSNSASSRVVPENNANVQMGITCGELSDEVAKKYNLEKGMLVLGFASDSPAVNTDLQLYDVITKANGTRVTTFEELFAVLEKMNPGDEITLTCYHVNQSGENVQASDSFEVTFQVQEKHSAVSSYPGA